MQSIKLWKPVVLAGSMLTMTTFAHAQSNTVIFQNLKIVTGAGTVINSGFVVVSGDKITSLGEGNPPMDPSAKVIDAKGLTAYPGLIDAYCAAGVAAPAAQPAPTFNQGGGNQRNGQQNRPAAPPPPMPAWRKATDGLIMTNEGLNSLRIYGFTAANVISRGPLTPGEDAIIALSGSDKPELIKERSGVNVNFQTRAGAYPGTLMGAIAFVRQAFYDGIDSHNHPPAKPDAKLDALGLAGEGKIPTFISTGTLNDAKRAIRFGQEFKIPAVVVGGAGIEPIAKQFAPGGPPLILTGAWDTAEALFKAGAEFALASGRIELDGDEVKSMIIKARDFVGKSNIPADKVLASLTSIPAKILGVSNIMGTLETGKLANMVITSGDLLKDGVVKYVIVKGQQVKLSVTKTAADQRPQRVAADGITPRTITFDDADGDGSENGGGK